MVRVGGGGGSGVSTPPRSSLLAGSSRLRGGGVRGAAALSTPPRIRCSQSATATRPISPNLLLSTSVRLAGRSSPAAPAQSSPPARGPDGERWLARLAGRDTAVSAAARSKERARSMMFLLRERERLTRGRSGSSSAGCCHGAAACLKLRPGSGVRSALPRPGPGAGHTTFRSWDSQPE